MAKAVDLTNTNSPEEGVPQFESYFTPVAPITETTSAASGAGSSPTDMTRTGIQTSGGGADVSRSCFAEVPVAPCTFGEYDLIEEIARGGMGVVYRARQKKLNRVVALKMILPGMLSSPTAIDRFYDEARAAATLDHPNIVPIYDIGERDGQHFFTMAFIEGRSLRDLIRKETVNFGEAVRLLKGIAEGVGFAHDHLIIHRDLKPDNVLIDKQGRPRVTDFGLAKRTDATTGLTVTGQILGTPTYMSPEQALGGNRTIGTPTDIYAVGGILYYTLTGQPPFQGDTMTEVLCQVIAQPPNSPRLFNPAIPDELEAICMKCLEKEPEKRFASCWELRDALIAWEQTSGLSTASTGSITVKTPSTERLGSDTAEDSLFAGLPKSFPPSTQKSVPQRKPWDYSTPAVPTPMPQERPSLELSGSRPIVLPSGKQPAVETPPKKNYLAMIVVMGLIFGGTVFAVSQWPKWFPSGQQEQVAVTPKEIEPKAGDPPTVASNKDVRPEPKVVPKPKQEVDLDRIPELQVKRTDFKVKVVMNGRLDPDGIRRFVVDDLASFDVTPEIDAYIGIWSVNGDGSVDQVFPNRQDPDHLCKAGQTRRLPPRNTIGMTKSTGIDQAWILASDKPWNPDQAEKDADLNFFLQEREWQKWLPKQRGMQVRNDLRIAETVIKFQVVPRTKWG